MEVWSKRHLGARLADKNHTKMIPPSSYLLYALHSSFSPVYSIVCTLQFPD